MDSRALLAALQHADSFFPSGAVSFSWGLEALRADGLVRTADDVALFIAALLRHRWATGDRPLLAAAHAAGDNLEAVRALDQLQEALALAHECERDRGAWARHCSASTRGSAPATPLPTEPGCSPIARRAMWR